MSNWVRGIVDGREEANSWKGGDRNTMTIPLIWIIS